MKTLSKILNPSAPAPLPSRAQLKATSVDAKFEQLKSDRAALMARMIEADKARMRQTQEPPSLLTDRVRELLDENDAPPPAETSGAAELYPMRLELEALDKAFAQISARREAEQLGNITAALARHRDEWDQLNVAIVRNFVELQALCRRRAEFMTTFVGAMGSTPLAKVPLDAIFKAGAPAKVFLETAVRVGTVTQKEIEP